MRRIMISEPSYRVWLTHVPRYEPQCNEHDDTAGYVYKLTRFWYHISNTKEKTWYVFRRWVCGPNSRVNCTHTAWFVTSDYRINVSWLCAMWKKLKIAKTDRHYPRNVLNRLVMKWQQPSCIRCDIPADLETIAGVWHRDWMSITVFSQTVYIPHFKRYNPSDQVPILLFHRLANMFKLLKSTAILIGAALLAPLVAFQGVTAPQGFNM